MRNAWLVAIGVAVLGCTHTITEEEQQFDAQMFLGEEMYKGSKFEEAVRAYRKALQLQPEHYQATIGLGASCSEASLTLYTEAEHMLSINKGEIAMHTIERADDLHTLAEKSFERALKLRPDDRVANYNIGLMRYKRATTPYNLPYPSVEEPPKNVKADPVLNEKWKQGIAQRRRERDDAIKQFLIVLSTEKFALDDAKHIKNCSSPHAHHYLALAFLTRGDWEDGDTERARQHLSIYMAWTLAARAEVVRVAPNKTAEEKRQKDKELEFFDRELLDLREILAGWEEGLSHLERQLRDNAFDCPIPAAKRPARLDQLTREKLVVEAMLREFDEGRKGKPKPKPN
jgi:tetratricopeptide (TPR) repeat protein